jgi:hypothetical protein
VWYPYGTVYQPLERDLGIDMSHLIERNTALLSINGSVREIHDAVETVAQAESLSSR